MVMLGISTTTATPVFVPPQTTRTDCPLGAGRSVRTLAVSPPHARTGLPTTWPPEIRYSIPSEPPATKVTSGNATRATLVEGVAVAVTAVADAIVDGVGDAPAVDVAGVPQAAASRTASDSNAVVFMLAILGGRTTRSMTKESSSSPGVPQAGPSSAALGRLP
jgi:hypothetical protein